MCDRSKFYETTLPSRENFYNSLNEHECSPEDYQHAVDTWNRFNFDSCIAHLQAPHRSETDFLLDVRKSSYS